MDQAPREQQAAAHPARELVDRVLAAVGQARELERPVDRGGDVGDAVEPREDREVVLDRDVDVEVVELRDDAHHARGRVFACRGSSNSSTRSSPESAIAWPVSSRIVVDLPAPFGTEQPEADPRRARRGRARRRR